jgi:hypothetical protein
VFPEHLKPYLKTAIEAAYQNQLWDDHREQGFLKALCSALPYNAYTLAVSIPHAPIDVTLTI